MKTSTHAAEVLYQNDYFHGKNIINVCLWPVNESYEWAQIDRIVLVVKRKKRAFKYMKHEMFRLKEWDFLFNSKLLRSHINSCSI